MQRKRKARGVTQLNRPCVATAIFRLCLLTCRNTSNHTPFTVWHKFSLVPQTKPPSLTFSSRNVRIAPPISSQNDKPLPPPPPLLGRRGGEKRISIHLPNRLELSLRVVRALPKASRIGFDSSTFNGKEGQERFN